MVRVVALVDDLFFVARIRETARLVGVELETVGTAEALIATVKRSPASLVIVDLNAKAGGVEAIEQVRKENGTLPIMAFLSHVQVELAERARAAGCEEVMPRSKFTKELASILARATSGE